MKRVEKFLKEDVCPDCGGTRLSEAARAPKLRGISLDEACKMTLADAHRNGYGGVPGMPARRRCARWRRASANPFRRRQSG